MARKFSTDIFSEEEADVLAFGVTLGENSMKALENIREASWFVEPFDVDRKENLLENVKTADVGDIDLSGVKEKVREIIDKKKIPLIFGGNHLTSLHSIQTFNKSKIIIFDAHADFKDNYDDEKIREMDGKDFDMKINDATWLRRLSEKFDSKNILLIGLRSCDEFEFKSLEENGIKYFTPNFIEDNLEEARQTIKEFTKSSNVYVSVDIDAFDPSIAPAVEMPEPDGLLFKQFRELVNSVEGKIVGADICCLKPIENNQITEFLAVKVIFEILGLISRAGVR